MIKHRHGPGPASLALCHRAGGAAAGTKEEQEQTLTVGQFTSSVKIQCLLVVLLINVESQGVHSQPQLCSLLILDVKVVDSVHFQVLGNL